MLNKFLKIGKEIVKELALSFFFVSLSIIIVHFCFQNEIELVFSLINKITIVRNENVKREISFDTVKKRLKSYPSYGSVYGKIKTVKIGMDLPLYYGDTPDILKYGVGHYAGSYFPGENGSIILAAHNNNGFFRRLPELQNGDTIVLETTYGTFSYEVYDAKVIYKTEKDKFPIQHNEEILMLYTCYPVSVLGYTNQRYVVYAKKVSEKL